MVCLFFAIHDTSIFFTATTIKDFLLSLGDADNTYLSIFSFLMPLAIFGIPIVDYVLQNHGYYFALQIINIFAIILSIIRIFFTNLNKQIIGFLIDAINKSLLDSIVFSFIPILLSMNCCGKGVGIAFFVSNFFSLYLFH